MIFSNYGNFKPYETECRCGCGADIQEHWRATLNQIRDEYGRPMRVNSGMRCPDYNMKVAGSPRSRHMTGIAADIAVSNANAAWALAAIALRHGLTVGVYENFLHLDDRPTPILFRGNY